VKLLSKFLQKTKPGETGIAYLTPYEGPGKPAEFLIASKKLRAEIDTMVKDNRAMKDAIRMALSGQGISLKTLEEVMAYVE